LAPPPIQICIRHGKTIRGFLIFLYGGYFPPTKKINMEGNHLLSKYGGSKIEKDFLNGTDALTFIRISVCQSKTVKVSCKFHFAMHF
jgi:hypothetical protein